MSDSAERRHLALEGELRQERASALARAGRNLEERFVRCRLLAEQIDADPDAVEAAELRRQHRQARQEFEDFRWRLCVQREAIGLNDHKWVDRVFPRPSPR